MRYLRVEPIPATRPRPPRCPEPRVPAAARRRRLGRARRILEAFPPANRYQSQLQGVALAMLSYMDQHWCGPGHAYDFERWWRIVDYYTRALGTPELAGNNRVAHEALARILDQNQVSPSKLWPRDRRPQRGLTPKPRASAAQPWVGDAIPSRP